jgi:hypothetical protein
MDRVKAIGIDPGKNGAIGWICCSGDFAVASLTGRSKLEIVTFIGSLTEGRSKNDWIVAGLEASAPHPKAGRKGLVTAARQVGLLEGALIAARIPYVMPEPKLWQAFYDLGTKRGETYDYGLHRAKKFELARELFPGVPNLLPDPGDALLIARYCLANWPNGPGPGLEIGSYGDGAT